MLIRSQQMQILEEENERSFPWRLAEFLRQRHGAVRIKTSAGEVALAEVSQSILESMVAFGLLRCNAWGLESKAQVAAFIALMACYGPRFDEHPAIKAELGNEAVPDSCRIDHVCATVPAPIWNALRTEHDARWLQGEHAGTR